MLQGLMGRSTSVGALKDGLDASAQRARQIAHRVANATTGRVDGFAAALEETAGAGDEAEAVDLEAEMVALADEQIRYEATARLLQKVYAQVRSAIRER